MIVTWRDVSIWMPDNCIDEFAKIKFPFKNDLKNIKMAAHKKRKKKKKR